MEPIYHVEIQFISRSHTRKASYSTKHVRNALTKAGFEVEGADAHRGEKQVIQKVRFSGTYQEAVEKRKEFELTMRVVTNNNYFAKFFIEKEEQG